MGGIRLHLRADRFVDLLARGDPAHQVAEVAGQGGCPMGQAWKSAEECKAERPSQAADAQLLLRDDDLRRARHSARRYLAQGATLFLSRLRSVPSIQSADRSGRENRRSRADGGSETRASGSI